MKCIHRLLRLCKNKSLPQYPRKWKEAQATRSEAIIKAEKEPSKPIKDMQKDTVKKLTSKGNKQQGK